MLQDVQEYKSLKLGDKFGIRRKYIPPCNDGIIPVSNAFVDYINLFENLFTVRVIYLVKNGAILSTWEVSGFLDFFQVNRSYYGKSISIINF